MNRSADHLFLWIIGLIDSWLRRTSIFLWFLSKRHTLVPICTMWTCREFSSDSSRLLHPTNWAFHNSYDVRLTPWGWWDVQSLDRYTVPSASAGECRSRLIRRISMADYINREGSTTCLIKVWGLPFAERRWLPEHHVHRIEIFLI